MAVDAEWHKRMDMLVELRQREPWKPFRKHLKETLKFFPLSTAGQRFWLSSRTEVLYSRYQVQPSNGT